MSAPVPAPGSTRLARARAALAAASAAPSVLAGERVVPVAEPLADLLPQRGLVRGQAVACRGSAAWSLALALGAGATRAGSWMVVVGLPGFGLQAAAEAGVALERTVVVAAPPPDQWAVTLGAAVDGAEVVLAPADAALPASEARRVHARLRTRGSILLLLDSPAPSGAVTPAAGTPGAVTPDLELSATTLVWEGIGQGDGRLVRRRVAVEVAGRRARTGRRCEIYLPDAGGGSSAVVAPPAVLHPGRGTPTEVL